jgi:hypothetical protein
MQSYPLLNSILGRKNHLWNYSLSISIPHEKQNSERINNTNRANDDGTRTKGGNVL